MEIDDLLFFCSKFMSDTPTRLNESERNRLDQIIEAYEDTRSISRNEISFLESLYRRSRIDE